MAYPCSMFCPATEVNSVRGGLLWAMFDRDGRHQIRGRSETDACQV